MSELDILKGHARKYSQEYCENGNRSKIWSPGR